MKPYRIAHFSDFHLCSRDEDFQGALELVEDALDRRVNHVLITGDVVNSAEMDVYRAFVRALFRRGLRDPRKLTIVPGNHDIFPDPREPPKWSRPTANYEKLWESIEPVMNHVCQDLRPDDYFPIAKRLHPDLLLVSLDSTRNGKYKPWCWAEGEIPEDHLDAVAEYFSRDLGTTHRILAMHHSPWEENFVGDPPFGQNFVEPSPDDLRDWIGQCGATFLFCGHVHARDGICRNPIRRCRMLRAGTAGSCDDEDAHGNAVRIYHLVDFHEDGRVIVKRRTMR